MFTFRWVKGVVYERLTVVSIHRFHMVLRGRRPLRSCLVGFTDFRTLVFRQSIHVLCPTKPCLQSPCLSISSHLRSWFGCGNRCIVLCTMDALDLEFDPPQVSHLRYRGRGNRGICYADSQKVFLLRRLTGGSYSSPMYQKRFLLASISDC